MSEQTLKQIEKIRILREAGNVKRCHVFPYHGEYTVGKHSYDAVSMLLVLHPNPSVPLIKKLMWHDCHERFLGDVPSPAKRHLRVLEHAYESCEQWVDGQYGFNQDDDLLTDEDKLWVRALDLLELWMWCLDQEAMGNKHIEPMFLNTDATLVKEKETVPLPVRQFLLYFSWKRQRDLGGEE